MKDLLQGVVISPWAEPDAVEEIQLWTKLKGLGLPRKSELKGSYSMSLDDYRKHMGVVKPPRDQEKATTERELTLF